MDFMPLSRAVHPASAAGSRPGRFPAGYPVTEEAWADIAKVNTADA
jgi:hypothetical protein